VAAFADADRRAAGRSAGRQVVEGARVAAVEVEVLGLRLGRRDVDVLLEADELRLLVLRDRLAVDHLGRLDELLDLVAGFETEIWVLCSSFFCFSCFTYQTAAPAIRIAWMAMAMNTQGAFRARVIGLKLFMKMRLPVQVAAGWPWAAPGQDRGRELGWRGRPSEARRRRTYLNGVGMLPDFDSTATPSGGVQADRAARAA
jgi:hypothetical protein